jgi:hypothetical protein
MACDLFEILAQIAAQNIPDLARWKVHRRGRRKVKPQQQ